MKHPWSLQLVLLVARSNGGGPILLTCDPVYDMDPSIAIARCRDSRTAVPMSNRRGQSC
jgi:hypothetical protein